MQFIDLKAQYGRIEEKIKHNPKINPKINEIIDWINSQQYVFYIDVN